MRGKSSSPPSTRKERKKEEEEEPGGTGGPGRWALHSRPASPRGGGRCAGRGGEAGGESGDGVQGGLPLACGSRRAEGRHEGLSQETPPDTK